MEISVHHFAKNDFKAMIEIKRVNLCTYLKIHKGI